MGQADIQPEVHRRVVAQSVKRDQTECAESGVSTANADQEENATIWSEIESASRIRNKIEERDEEAPAYINDQNRQWRPNRDRSHPLGDSKPKEGAQSPTDRH
jgi:hypothetical protein